jgi:hypothetical protein
MAEPSKGLVQRILEKAGDTFGEKLGERLFTLLLALGIGSALVKWLVEEWACIRQPQCKVPGWLHGILMVSAVVGIAAALVLGRWWLRARRDLRALQARISGPPAFRDIEVEDQKLNLRWFIRRRPSLWLNWRNVATTISPAAVHDVLDGPFHAAPGCNAPLVEIQRSNSTAPPQFDQECRSCGRQVFRGARFDEGYGVDVWAVRAGALEELQRMQRNGTKLPEAQWRAPVVLENPEYWKLMLPPA